MNDTVALTTAQLASALLMFKGQPFSLKGYEPFTDIYNVDPPELTVKCSRQVGKSLSIGAVLATKCVARPFFTYLSLSPLSQQASRFSTVYLDPFLDSKLVKKYYRDTSSKKNVFEKTLNNGSIIFLSYAETEQDANRVRGIAGDALSIDEVQDVQYEMLPVVYEILSASPYAYKRHYGTPKSSQNTLELLFQKSNGLEYCIKCTHCNKWNIPWTLEDCLAMCKGDEGPICVKCGQLVDITTGKWLSTRPDVKDHIGFHLPRFVLSARANPKKWGELKHAITHYGPVKLANEVFGLASGMAGRILSMKEAMDCCNASKIEFDGGWPRDYRGITSVVIGVDWSVTAGIASYTVVNVLGYDYMGKCYVLFTERLQGVDILDQVRRVEQLFHQFNAKMVGSDRGVGQLQVELLRQSLGVERVVSIQYCAQKVAARFDKQAGFLAVDRTQALDTIVLKMKLGKDKFECPRWDIMSTFWKDALAVYEEESISGRRLYRKDENTPDDWLHSVCFGHIAWMCFTGQYNIVDMLPYKEGFDSDPEW